jgi:diadenosine tetraphosphate (Ap4A) HIT family hydrolase
MGRASCARSSRGRGCIIAFPARPVTLLGYCIVTPKRHVEDWVRELDENEFMTLQRVVRRVAEAVSEVVPTERMYSLSLGSKQGNAHLHWHVAPLPRACPMATSSTTRS